MKTLFITALFHIKLRGILGRGIRLPNDLILTNSPEQISKLLSSNFERLVGLIETSALRGSNAAIYCVSDHSHAFPKTEGEARRLLNERLAQAHLFLLALWLVKDNSVNVESGFLEYPHGDPRRSTVTSNSRAVRFAKADGSLQETEFTESEARGARDLYSKLFAASVIDQDEYRGYLVPEDFSRLSRLFYFIQAARGSSDLGNKIASYVTCFEALFCTDSSEMAHKLSERVAFFLAETGPQRSQIFKQVKTAYNIRSKVVHGDKIGRRLAEQALGISVTSDDLLRNALGKILTTRGLPEVFSGPSQALEEYLTSLVLGDRSMNANNSTQPVPKKDVHG